MHPMVDYIKQNLHGHYPDSETMSMARLLLKELFGMTDLEIYCGKVSASRGQYKANSFDFIGETKDTADQRRQLDKVLARLKNREPLQYILGKETFCGLTLEVTPEVLIPRPETAELVEWITATEQEGPLSILDIGTGSGCIAIALAQQLKGAAVTAWDISEAALQVAARNAERSGMKVRFERRNVLLDEDCPSEARFDLIVSNPPYVTEKEKAAMDDNVLLWEPALALFVPDDRPLLFYRRIAELGLRILKPGGRIYFEINRDYGAQTVAMLQGLGYRNVCLRKDLSQNDRMIRCER